MRKLLQFLTKHYPKILIGFFFVSLLIFYARIFATPLYGPGDTLDPSCAPGSTDCVVSINATDIAYSNSIYTTVADALDSLLYVAPSVSAFTITITGSGASSAHQFEVGSSKTLTGFDWTINKTITSESITNSYTSGAITPVSTRSISGLSTTLNPVSPTTYTYTMNASDGTNSATRNATVQFLNRKYYGVETEPIATISDAQVRALTNSPLSATRVTASTSFAPSGQYVYFAWPTTFEPSGNCKAVDSVSGSPVGTVDCFMQGSTPITDFKRFSRTFVNASGDSRSYHIYQSQNLLTGSISYSVQ